MKKNKNEAVNTNNADNGKNIPSGTAHNVDEREFPFKKILYGYNPEEVASFINELNSAYESSLKLQESKLSSIKEELILSNRERDYYIEKCKKFKAEAENQNTDKTSEYKSTVANLTEKLRMLADENEFLKSKNSSPPDDYISRISELEKNIDSSKKENEILKQQIDKYKSVSDECKSIIIKYKESEAVLESNKKEIQSKADEICEKDKKISLLSDENDSLRSRISELEIRNSVLSKQVTDAEKEISVLKETNRTLVFENAEKINEIRNEYSGYKLSVQKELKLYGYYADRAELTVAELSEQLAQIRQAVENSQF